MLIKKGGILNKDKLTIFRPFLKSNVSNPCSLCIFKQSRYRMEFGRDGCNAKGFSRLYLYVCRGFDTLDYYYIPKYCVKKKT